MYSYNLIEYYEENDIIKSHLVNYANTKSEINKIKTELANELNNIGITSYEIIATKNINSLKKILKRDDIKIFQVIKNN